MKRKVNKVGQSTLTVSLPSRWAKDLGLKVGDELELEADDGTIHISKGSITKKEKKTKIHLTNEDKGALRSIFGGLYRSGYDEIEVISDSYDSLIELQNTLDIMPAFEYFEQSKQRAIVRNVVSGMNFDIQEGITKMRHTLNVMHDILKESMKNNNYGRYEEIKKFRLSVLKYRDIVSRMIIKDRRIENSSFPYYIIAFVLATMAGIFRTFYHGLGENKYKVSDDVINYLDSVILYFNDLMAGKKSPAEIHFELLDLEEKAFPLMKKRKEEVYAISFAFAIARQIQSMNSSFLMLRIEQTPN